MSSADLSFVVSFVIYHAPCNETEDNRESTGVELSGPSIQIYKKHGSMLLLLSSPRFSS